MAPSRSWFRSDARLSLVLVGRRGSLRLALAVLLLSLGLLSAEVGGAQGGPDEATPAAADAGAADGEAASADLPSADPQRLAHVHAGTCDELGIVVYALPDLRSYRLEADGASGGATELIVGTVDVPLTDLFAEPFSVHVHQDVDNKQVYLGCADIGGQPAEPWSEADGLALAVVEQAGSGFSGLAALRPAAEGGTLVSLFLARPGAEGAAPTPAATPPPGTTYTSPSYGYALFYAPTWEVTEEVSAGGRDRFVLANGTSFVTFTAAEGFGGDPARCVDDFVASLTADPNVDNLELAVDENGDPLAGGTAATGAFAVYDHDYAFPDRVESYTLFVGCIPLVPGEAVLAVVQNVPADDYNDQVPLREALLRGLTLPQ